VWGHIVTVVACYAHYVVTDTDGRKRVTSPESQMSASLNCLWWLEELDAADQEEAIAEVRDAAAVARATHDSTAIRQTLRAWAVTVETMRDVERRAILAGPGDDADFVEVDAPA
jgi:hypothetical protein